MNLLKKLMETRMTWKKRVSAALACIVVFVTVYAMVLPAITLDQDAADQEDGLALDTEKADSETDPEETDPEEADPAETDFSEEDFAFEEENAEDDEEDTWAMTEGPVTLLWPDELALTEEAAVLSEESDEEEEIDYSVEATFGEESGLPADVILQVAEIKAGTEEYEAYLQSSLEAVRQNGGDEKEISYARFFDITFLTAEGLEVEPTGPVSIVIRYKDEKALKAEAAEELSVVHFAREDQEEKENQENQKSLEDLPQPEIMEIETEITDDQVESITFGSESFSVYGVVGTYTVEVDAEEGEGGEHASFSHSSSLVGGGSILLSELLEEAWPDREDLRVGNVAEVTAGEASAEEADDEGENDGIVLKVSFNEGAGDYEVTADPEEEADISGKKGTLTVHFNDGNTALFRITISGTPEVKTDLAVISSADGSYLPESAEGSAEELSGDEISDAAAGAAKTEGDQTTVSKVFDISLNLTQEEQAAYEGGFLVNLTLPEEVTGRDFHLYHIHDGQTEELAIEKTGSVLDETGLEAVSAVQFVTESFSEFVLRYTVDFHWEVNGKQYEFSLPGGGFVSFTKLMEVLSIADNEEQNNSEESQADAQDTEEKQYAPALTLDSVQVRESTKKFVEDVEKVEFTSPELMWVGKVDSISTVGELKEANGLNCEYSAELAEEQIDQINAMKVDGGDWALISLKAFSTEEMLTVTMKDQSVFKIKVTDAQDPSVFLGKEVIIYDNQEKRAMTSNWDNNNRPELQSIAEGEADGIDSAHWMLEYDGNQQGYYLKAKNGKYLYLTDNDIRLMDNRSQATLLNIQRGGNPDYYITAKNNGNYVLTYCDNAQYDGYFCARNGGYNGANTRNWLYIREAAPVADPVGDWLLYFDDDFDEVTIHVGETITLRPYDRWEWKEGNADVQSKHWIIDGRDDNYWNQIDSNDGNGAHKETWSSGGSNGVAGFDWTAYVKKDTELVTHYWSVQGRATAVGDYTLTNTKNGKTITVHVEEGDPTTTPEPITNTVDFAVNLFDYDKNGTLDPSNNSNLANNPNNKSDSTNAMNGGSKFYFLSSGSGNNGADSWNQYTSGAAKPDIVKDTLDSEGYPQLAGRGQNSQSLKYLFDTSKQQWNGGKSSDTQNYPDGMIAYPNVNGMFQKDDDGYYYFNSNTNYFYYNTETGESKLYQHTYTQTSSADKHSLVNDKPIGFFPFHDYDATDNLYVNQNSNLNHHLGMSMEIPFRMKEDKKDANGNDIKFEFTGDDDLWVFAEWEDANGNKQSKLLLDIGGIHQPVYGAIDFTNDTSTSLDENETMGLQPGVDYTLKVFYLERGGCDSNLAVRFNLPLTERGDIPFTKRDCLTNDPLPGAVFGLYTDEDCTQKLRQATSDNEGHVLFTDVGIGTYYMKEITPPNGYNPSTAVYRVDVKSKKKAEITLINGTDAPSDYSYNVDNRPIMLTVKKAWIPTSAADTADPVYFKLYKKGNPDTEIRNSDYGYVNSKGYKLDGSNSWTATFRDLSQGQYYVVESPVPNGYTVMYAVGEDISAENLKKTAKDASTDQNGNLTILNRQNKMDIGVEKTWEGIDPTDSSLEGANITVTLKRYKLVDILGTLKVTTDIINSGDPAYDFSATYQVIDSAGKVVKEFTATESAEQMFNDIPVGTYTVTETLAVPDPDLGYEITHDPALESGAVSHSITVMVTKNHTEENPALAAFESSYTPKVGQLTITKTVNGAPNGYSFDATYTVKRGDTVIGTYSYGQLSKTLTLPEGNYTVIESNVSADPEHHLSQHSSQTLNNIQVRAGSPQTAEFTTTYTPANPVYVTAVYFQNRTTPSNRRTDVNRELFYGGQTILICWRQKNTETNGNVLYINGNWYKGYGNPNYREVEYVLPESGGDVLIEISDTWWPNGIDGKITVKLKEENPDPEPAQSMSNGPMMMSSSGRRTIPARSSSTVTQDNTVTPPSVPAEFMDSKIYVIDGDYTQNVVLTQNGNWKKTDISVDPVDENGYPYHYFISNVTETGIEGRVTVTIDDKLVNKDNKDTLKLSLKNKVEKNGALELTKIVAGTGADEEKEFEFTIALIAPEGQTLADSYTFKKNGNAADGITYTKDTNDAAKATVTGISLKHNDVFTIEDLPAGTTYLITEGNYSSEGYSSSLPAEGLGGTITGGNKEKESVTVTNTLSAGSLTVEKTLEGNATDDQKDFSFSVTFNKARLNGVAGSYKTGRPENIETATSEDITFASGEATVSFTLKGGEIAQFTGIPVGTTFTVSETSKDTNGYETSVSNTGGTVNSVEKTVTGSISATAAVTASYVNKKNKLEAEAVKQWKSGTQTITWPVDVEKVAFTLYKTVNGSTTPVTSADLTDYATAEQIAAFQNPVEITSTTEEKKAAWDNLPAKYWLAADANASPAVEAGWYEAVYSVKETKIFYTDGTEKDVDVAATEGVITNEVEKVRIHASKKWKDKNGVELDGTEGKEIPIGAQVTYTLVKDGTEVPAHAVILNGVDETKDPVSGGEITPQNTDYEGAGWTAWFTELPKYNDDGTLVIYSVKETGKWTGYEIEGPDSVGDEGTIYNKESSIDINILKVDMQNNKPLTGATFVLRRYDEGYHQVLETWDAQQVSAEAGKEGTLTFEKLQVGWYELEETISPTGYVKTTSNPRFTVTADQEGNLAVTFINSEMVTYDSTVQTFTVKNEPGAALPSTGGPGSTALYLLGIMLTGFAGAGLVMRKRRRDAA